MYFLICGALVFSFRGCTRDFDILTRNLLFAQNNRVTSYYNIHHVPMVAKIIFAAVALLAFNIQLAAGQTVDARAYLLH